MKKQFKDFLMLQKYESKYDPSKYFNIDREFFEAGLDPSLNILMNHVLSSIDGKKIVLDKVNVLCAALIHGLYGDDTKTYYEKQILKHYKSMEFVAKKPYYSGLSWL